ncbi:MAG: hypothetical protein IJ069_06840 [Prevotella sp.]|nr:hypothetical protein [Prevotella sp.]
MMKKIRLTYTFLLAAALSMLTACSSDDAAQGGGETLDNGSIKIHLRVAAAGSGTMRAWTDNASATTEEMMNVWTVVAVNDDDNKVAAIYACKPTGEPDREIDQIAELPNAGKYRFYSFANMSPKVVMNLLNIAGSGTASNMRDGGTSYDTNPPTGGGNDNDNNSALGSVTNNGEATGVDGFITDDNTYGKNKLCDIEFTESTVTAASVEAKEVNVAGNNFDLTTHNGFGATGIPMSNVQTKTVSDGSNVELVVIRMMAKIELQVYNDKGSDVTVESFTLTDVTKNSDGNLKLLPSLSDAGHDVMTIPTHGDISPNLGTSTSKGDIKLYPNETVSASANNTTTGTPMKFTFYVNESVEPTNAFNHFFLKIKLAGEAEERYVLIDDKGSTTADDNKWDYIARNDYRIIPIVLDDYKLDMIPYDFPAIGVYPASVKEEDGIYTINFHDYGHFHLLPVVKKLSDSSVVPFATTAPTGTYSSTSWGLINDDFANSWGSWTDATKATEYVNESADPAFYRKGYASWVPVDGDEVGGEPKWYVNDGIDGPQWDPAASGTYRPFILGYVADPGEKVTADRKVYHEFSVYLYKQGMSAPRQMTYRLYMILDTDQMLYSRQFGAPRVRHTHGY